MLYSLILHNCCQKEIGAQVYHYRAEPPADHRFYLMYPVCEFFHYCYSCGSETGRHIRHCSQVSCQATRRDAAVISPVKAVKARKPVIIDSPETCLYGDSQKMFK